MRAGLCLTIDVEQDYGRAGTYGVLDKAAPFIDWIREEKIPVTAFVIGRLFQEGHPIIDSLLNAGASLGVHGFSHSPGIFRDMHTNHADEINKGLAAFERRVGRKPAGYRAPAGVISRDDVLMIDKLGFRYDASVFPMRRPIRYDFSQLPKSPFRWNGTGLVEIPFGLLTRRLPAGMSFINLFGPKLSAYLARRMTAGSHDGDPAYYVTDIHLHNLFTSYQAMGCLPFAMRLIYLAGSFTGGFPTLVKFVDSMRHQGFVLYDLEAYALSLKAEQLPVVNMDCFDV